MASIVDSESATCDTRAIGRLTITALSAPMTNGLLNWRATERTKLVDAKRKTTIENYESINQFNFGQFSDINYLPFRSFFSFVSLVLSFYGVNEYTRNDDWLPVHTVRQGNVIFCSEHIVSFPNDNRSWPEDLSVSENKTKRCSAWLWWLVMRQKNEKETKRLNHRFCKHCELVSFNVITNFRTIIVDEIAFV